MTEHYPPPNDASEFAGMLRCSVAEAARLLGVSETTVRERIEGGMLPADYDGARWTVFLPRVLLQNEIEATKSNSNLSAADRMAEPAHEVEATPEALTVDQEASPAAADISRPGNTASMIPSATNVQTDKDNKRLPREGRSDARLRMVGILMLWIVTGITGGYVTATLFGTSGDTASLPPPNPTLSNPELSSLQQPNETLISERETPTPTRRTSILGASDGTPAASPTQVEVTPDTTPSPIPPSALPLASTTAVQDQPPDATTAPDRFVEATFNSDTGEWIVERTPTWSAKYVDGKYRLMLDGQPSIGFSSAIDTDSYDVSADVAVSKGAAGITFLGVEPASFFRFLIRPDGTYTVQMYDQATGTHTDVIEWTATAALTVGDGVSNHLQVTRRGATVQLLANGQLLTDFSIPPGNVRSHYGVVLAAQDGQGEASFDNLIGERFAR